MKQTHKNGLVKAKLKPKLQPPRSWSPAKAAGAPAVTSAKARGGFEFRLEAERLLQIHDTMVKARVLEERLIRMYKQSDGYFWLGGPGEEAFNTCLGMQIKKGQGLDHDFMHLHYRSSAIMLVLGMDPKDPMRQMKNTATDPFSGGRNFCGHYSKHEWNVVPITSTIETQYSTSIGSGIAQKRHGGTGITIVTGGDAGTAEGDFASCLIWTSRPANPLPVLIIVTNNQWGISTAAGPQHGDTHVADRGKAFNIQSRTINGNDVQEAWFGIQEAMSYVRKERKPYLLEARVSRLYGHSSASGANWVGNEEDPLATFEKQLESAGLATRKQMDELRARYTAEYLELAAQVKQEPMPDPSTIYDHTYKGQKGKYW